MPRFTEDGTVYSWGFGYQGRTGHGNDKDLAEPKPIEALKGKKVFKIICGVNHSLVLVEVLPT